MDHTAPELSPTPTPSLAQSTQRAASSGRFIEFPHVRTSTSPAFRRLEPYIKPPPLLLEELEALAEVSTREDGPSPTPSQEMEVLAEEVYQERPSRTVVLPTEAQKSRQCKPASAHTLRPRPERKLAPIRTKFNPYRIYTPVDSISSEDLTPSKAIRIEKWRIEVHVESHCFRGVVAPPRD
ncbi:hypothetical protein MJO29_012220 [Puccinia striiformis f. sp. tritici]|nr:hypothetical protein Pst134EB_023768 [Puccinia striiformis f. sp. tritici]KAI7945832.1 hypothetical protein MJO29_012220 [Puccinia striiformis f. sp. tritici]